MIVNKKIHASLCNMLARLDIVSAIEVIEDMVTEKLGEMKLDNLTLDSKYNYMWVFTKNKITIERMPNWGENVILECKPIRINRLLCFLETTMKDMDGNLLLSSIIECCILDKKTLRFVKLTDVGMELIDSDIDIKYSFKNIDKYDLEEDFNVSATMLDSSLHLNNAKSIRKMIDSLSLEEFNDINLSKYTLNIKYSSIAEYKTLLILKKYRDNMCYQFRLMNNDKEVVIAEINKKEHD